MMKNIFLLIAAVSSLNCFSKVLAPKPDVTLEIVRPTSTTYEFRLCEGPRCRLLGRGTYTERELLQVAAVDPEKASKLSVLLTNPAGLNELTIPMGFLLGFVSACGITHMVAEHSASLFVASTTAFATATSVCTLSPLWSPLIRMFRLVRATNDKVVVTEILNESNQLSTKEFKRLVRGFERTLRHVDSKLYCDVDLQEPKIVALPYQNPRGRRR